jgi:DNA-binding MarR family transcriptional regulator
MESKNTSIENVVIDDVEKTNPEAQLDEWEYRFLKTINSNHRKRWYARHIASELDASPQRMGNVGKKLSQRGFVTRDKNRNAFYYQISSLARETFFPGT